MGAGIGRQIRERFPDAYKVYLAHSKARKLRLGAILTVVPEALWEARVAQDKAEGRERRGFAGIDRITQDRRWPPELVVVNAMTQFDYGRSVVQVDYTALQAALGQVFRFAAEFGIDTIHMPKIGTGLAGGSWERVEPLLVQAHRSHPSAQVFVWSLPEGVASFTPTTPETP
jgi:O-acetyl-ADP-ribose deacetylase (regulator of RNase III)